MGRAVIILHSHTQLTPKLSLSYTLHQYKWMKMVNDVLVNCPQLKKAYKDASGHHDDLKTHLLDAGSTSRKINSTMEHYGYITCTLTLQADRLLQCRETAATDLKLVRY